MDACGTPQTADRDSRWASVRQGRGRTRVFRLALLPIAIVALLVVVALPVAAAAAVPSVPVPIAGISSGPLLSSPAHASSKLIWAHAPDSLASRGLTAPTGALAAGPKPAGGFNTSWCDIIVNPPPAGQLTPVSLLNFSVAISPANSTPVGPVNFSWKTTVYGGGLPPYHAEVWIDSYTFSWAGVLNQTNYTSFLGSGNLTLTIPGVYTAMFEIFDSTCLGYGLAYDTFQVVDASLGVHPVWPVGSASTPHVPANVTFAVNGTVPANYTVQWDSFPFWSNANSVSETAYLAGNYSANLCLQRPDGRVYSCVSSANVTILGPSAVSVAVVVGTGPSPVQVDIWANATNASWLPANYSLRIYATNGTASVINFSSGLSDHVGMTVNCGLPGYPVSIIPDPSGVCRLYYFVSITNPSYSVDQFWDASFNVTATGNASNWFITTTFSYGPTNATAPTNFSLNLSAANGIRAILPPNFGPYLYWVTVFGRTSYLANGTFLPTQYASNLSWNGSLTHLTYPLNSTGIYLATVFVEDTKGHCVSFFVPLISLGVVVPGQFPLSVVAHVGQQTSLGVNTTGLLVTFTIQTTGGNGPYTVEWDFGDGSVGTSLPTANVTHLYRAAGTYQAQVRVTDGSGDAVTTVLPALTVTAAPTSTSGSVPPTSGSQTPIRHPPSHSAPSPWTAIPPSGATAASRAGAGSWIGWLPAILLGAFFGAAALGVWRRELRREGEELTKGLETSRSDDPPR